MNIDNNNMITRFAGDCKRYKFDNYHLVIHCKNDMANITNFEYLIYGYFKLSLSRINIPYDILQKMKHFADEKYFDYAKYYGWQICLKSPTFSTNNEDNDLTHIDTRSWELESFDIYKQRSDVALFANQLSNGIKEKIWNHFDTENKKRLDKCHLNKLIAFIFLLKYKIDKNEAASVHYQKCVNTLSETFSNDIINTYKLKYVDKNDFIQFIGNWFTLMAFSKEWRDYLNNEDSMCDKRIISSFEENDFDFNMIYENTATLLKVLRPKHRQNLWNATQKCHDIEIMDKQEHISKLVVDCVRLYILFDKGLKTKPVFTPSMEYKVRQCGAWIFDNYSSIDKRDFIQNTEYFSRILSSYIQR